MPIYLSVLCLFVAAILQVTVLPSMTTSEVGVDLVLLLVVAWGIIKGVQEGLLWGLLGGLILEAGSAAPFGTTMAVLGAIGLASGFPATALLRKSFLWLLVAGAAATVVYDGFLMVIWALMGRAWQWLDVLGTTVLPAIVINAVVMVPVYYILHLATSRGEPEPKW